MAFVLLYEPGGPYAVSLVESLLRQNDIEYRRVDKGVSPVVLGMPSSAPWGGATVQIMVPEDRLEEAKRLLCEHDIVCDISERLRRRGFESVAMPLLTGQSEDLPRLANYLRVNNKATVEAILTDIFEHRNGPELLVLLFMHLLGRDERVTLSRVSRFLDDHPVDSLGTDIAEVLPTLDASRRRDLAEMLGLLPSLDPRDLLVSLLADADRDVREAAIESLFSLTGTDHGFEPDAPEEDRLAAVQRWQAAL
jgi:hypothetical protein